MSNNEEIKRYTNLAETGDAAAQNWLGWACQNGKGVPQDIAEAVKWYSRAAEQGNADAQKNLGNMFQNGWGVPKDNVEAAKWYRKAAEQGDSEAQYKLGKIYEDGICVQHDYAEAVKWYHKAAEQGEAEAQYRLGEMFFSGQDVDEDNEEAIKWYRQAAVQGHVEAQYKLGEVYYYGQGVDEDYEKAVEWFQDAADHGHAEAQYGLGKMYYYGKGVDEDNDEAFKWFHKAAEQGNANAQYQLGVIYKNGQGVGEDIEEAIKWFRKAAEQGHTDAKHDLNEIRQDNVWDYEAELVDDVSLDNANYNQGKLFEDIPQDEPDNVKRYHKAAERGDANAQCQLGWIYYIGKDISQDYVEAVKWYRKAAEQGYANAQFSLGVMYADGTGVPKNDAQAVKWFHKAAEQGNANAQVNLGWMCQNGKGVPKNDAQAVKWYHKAAEQRQEKAISNLTDMSNKGNSAAQFYLGVMYANGQGVTQNDAEAVKWYRKAAAQGNEKAKQQLEEIEGVEDVFIDNGKGKVENIIAAKSNLSIDIIFNNPFRIIGLPSNAKETEILKQVNYLRTFIELGKTPKIDMEVSCFPSCNRTLKSIEEAQGKIEQSENRFLNSFFWYSNEDSVNQLALDVLSEGKIKKSIALWEKHLDQYIVNHDSFEENIQHEHFKNAIIDEILIPYLEDNYNIDTILSEIPSDSDLRIILEYYATDIMEWHLNSNDYCYAVISDDPVGVDDNGEDMTLNIQINKTSIDELSDNFLALPEKEWSYAKNLMVLYLGLAFKNNEFNLTHFNKSLYYTGLLFHSNESLSQYTSSIIGTHYGYDRGEKIAKFFVDEILKCIKPLLNDNLSGETFKEIAESFNSFPDYLRRGALRELTNKLTNNPIRDINKKVEETAEKRTRNPFKANEYGKELYDNSYNILIRLKDILSVDNLQYQNISDAVADEIESCCVEYFKNTREADNDTDPGEDALKLAKQAFSITTNARIKNRIEGSMPILEKWVEDKPLRERVKRAKPYIDDIVKQLKGLPDPDKISPSELIIAESFLDSCTRSLNSLKSVFILNRSSMPSIIFLEQFEDNENKWGLNEEGDFLRKIENGQYILQSKNVKSGHWAWGANQINFGNIDNFDFTIECSINKIKGVDNVGFGIMWSFRKENDKQNYFSFKISGNGYYTLNEYKQGECVGNFKWTPTTHLYGGDKTNVLTVHKHLNSVDICINGKRILSKENVINGNNMTGSGIGFDVASDMTIGVDYLYFCNANISDFRPIFDYNYYMDLSSAVASRTLDFCIAYANRTNDMKKPITLINKMRLIDMKPELKNRFDKNENILRRNVVIEEANTPPVKKLFKKVMKWLE